jgi:hypothetical protein
MRVSTALHAAASHNFWISFRGALHQLAAFKFKANHNYTGLIFPAAEIPTRPSLRISDSNQDWSGIRAPKKEEGE